METLLKLIAVFFQIGLFSIGGGYAVIPLIKEQVVDRLGWIPERTFTDIITISQMTPGPLAVNTSTFIGLQIGGTAGAVLATGGCVVSGIVLSLFLYRFFQKKSGTTWILELQNGLKAASFGLILSAAATLLRLAFTKTGGTAGGPGGNGAGTVDWAMAAIFLCSFGAARKWKLHPVFLMVFTGMAGWIAFGR